MRFDEKFPITMGKWPNVLHFCDNPHLTTNLPKHIITVLTISVVNI